MGKTEGIMRLIRPVNCTVMGFAVIVGIMVAVPDFSLEGKAAINAVLGFTTGFTFLATANVINDYYDREIDAVNEPNRPIPSGVIRPKEALVYASILSIVGYVTAFLTNIECLVIATSSWVLLMYYSTKGKRTGLLGNIVVSACIALPFIYGGFAAETGVSLILGLFSAMAFLSNTGREITKGIVDIEGDKLQGIKTIAVRSGPRTAAVASVCFYAAAVTLSLLPLVLESISFWYLPFVALADLGFVSSSISLLRNFSRENARRIKNLVRLWMVIGLLAFVMGKFSWKW